MEHHDALVEATNDGNISSLWYTSAPSPDKVAESIQTRLAQQAQGEMLPFATRRLSDNKVIGVTTLYDPDPRVPRVEVGYTWNAASAHGSGTNADSKLLLFTHAFEVLRCEAVRLRTSWNNNQSREAIARLGAKQDGVLRNDQRTPDGFLRDSVWFSILKHEWPGVEANLKLRVAKHR